MQRHQKYITKKKTKQINKNKTIQKQNKTEKKKAQVVLLLQQTRIN